mmetsp:Transcript_32754/g.110326  ORF Transcript_32754/g.110326 Transcript_32754/m.110326 type:complete len:463 (-) Transcript_32754:1333-2721(-)
MVRRRAQEGPRRAEAQARLVCYRGYAAAADQGRRPCRRGRNCKGFGGSVLWCCSKDVYGPRPEDRHGQARGKGQFQAPSGPRQENLLRRDGPRGRRPAPRAGAPARGTAVRGSRGDRAPRRFRGPRRHRGAAAARAPRFKVHRLARVSVAGQRRGRRGFGLFAGQRAGQQRGAPARHDHVAEADAAKVVGGYVCYQRKGEPPRGPREPRAALATPPTIVLTPPYARARPRERPRARKLTNRRRSLLAAAARVDGPLPRVRGPRRLLHRRRERRGLGEAAALRRGSGEAPALREARVAHRRRRGALGRVVGAALPGLAPGPRRRRPRRPRARPRGAVFGSVHNHGPRRPPSRHVHLRRQHVRNRRVPLAPRVRRRREARREVRVCKRGDGRVQRGVRRRRRVRGPLAQQRRGLSAAEGFRLDSLPAVRVGAPFHRQTLRLGDDEAVRVSRRERRAHRHEGRVL